MKLSEFLRARRWHHRNRFPYPVEEANITLLVNRDREAAEFAGKVWDDELPPLHVDPVGQISPPMTDAQQQEVVRRCNVHGDVRARVDRIMPGDRADLRGELLALLDRGLAGLDE